MKSTNIRIDDVTFSYEDFYYRTPIKFGGVALDRVTILNVNVTVRTDSVPIGRFRCRKGVSARRDGAARLTARQVRRLRVPL